jgi:hypothetical protein
MWKVDKIMREAEGGRRRSWWKQLLPSRSKQKTESMTTPSPSSNSSTVTGFQADNAGSQVTPSGGVSSNGSPLGQAAGQLTVQPTSGSQPTILTHGIEGAKFSREVDTANLNRVPIRRRSTVNGSLPSPAQRRKESIATVQSTKAKLLITRGNLWDNALEALREDNPKLISEFEKCLALEASGIASSTSPSKNDNSDAEFEIVESIIVNRYHDRHDETLARKSAVVRKYFEQVVKAIIASKSFISAAISSDPYSSLAWTGVCLLLPVRSPKSNISISDLF